MNEAEFDKLLCALRKDADGASWFIGFLKAIVDSEEVAQRLDGSRSGYAGAIARAAAKESLVMYFARAWDKRNDVFSLRRAVGELPDLSELDARRQKQIEALHGPRKATSLFKQYDSFNATYNSVIDTPLLHSLMLLRHEYFAHRSIRSNDRVKFEENGMFVPDPKLRQLIELSEKTISLVGKLGYLWESSSNPYPGRVERATNYCREFWRLVPVLKDVERIED